MFEDDVPVASYVSRDDRRAPPAAQARDHEGLEALCDTVVDHMEAKARAASERPSKRGDDARYLVAWHRYECRDETQLTHLGFKYNRCDCASTVWLN
jgi:hypothetical protein